MADALDYSWSRPDPATLAQQGIKLVARYLSHDDSKDLSAGEAQSLHTAGIGVLLNWESDAGRPLLGGGAGTADGRDAAARAESRGAPHGLTIYYSCDTNTDPWQWPSIASYYRAAGAATAGRFMVGVYGEADLVEYLHNAGVVTSEWQTYAWSGGRLSPEADLYQYLNGQSVAGASVDMNRIIHADKLGAWWPAGSPNINQGDDMQADERQWLKALYDERAKIDKMGFSILGSDTQPSVREALQGIASKVGAPPAIDYEKFALALVPHLPTVNAEQITAAVRAVFADAATK